MLSTLGMNSRNCGRLFNFSVKEIQQNLTSVFYLLNFCCFTMVIFIFALFSYCVMCIRKLSFACFFFVASYMKIFLFVFMHIFVSAFLVICVQLIILQVFRNSIISVSSSFNSYYLATIAHEKCVQCFNMMFSPTPVIHVISSAYLKKSRNVPPSIDLTLVQLRHDVVFSKLPLNTF